MPSLKPTRPTAIAALSCLLVLPIHASSQTATAAPPPAYSTLPPAQPTAQPTPPVPAAVTPHPSNHAEVAFTQGLLSVSANDSSLNQILRQISRETGTRIIGGVADERVFGHYGPSSPSQVLSALLDGTGSNMLLVRREGNTPAELILTPRTGGPTPPNPSADVFNEPSGPATAPEKTTNGAQNGSPAPSALPSENAPPVSPSTNSTNSQSAAEPQSPNGVKTPQQIYDQLQLLRNQQPPPAPQ